jgi:glycosyltransferase involved in cell wall biosynthesis
MYARRLERYLKEHTFNIIHAHDWVTFEAAEKAAKLKGIPWIAHFHSTERDRHGISIDNVIFRIEKHGAEKATHIVTPSNNTASKIKKDYKIGKDKISAIPNVLSKEFLEPNEVGVYETGRIVFLGRLTHQKAPDRFSDLAARYSGVRKNKIFLIWGEGEEYSNLFYNYNIRLMGGLNWKNRGLAFDGASAVYVPSRSEPFGMVILEAMQHRVPVLYPNHAGVSEIIKTDLVVNPEDTESVAEKLRKLLDDWQYWEDIVEKQESELEKFNKRRDDRELLSLWNQIVKNTEKKDTEALKSVG